MDAAQHIVDLCHRWRAAELHGDPSQLAPLATDDFTLVGPAGFVLDRAQWLARFGPHGLHLDSLDWTVESVRTHRDAALVIGVQDQRASFAGQRADGRFRITHIAVPDTEWRLAMIQYSPLGGPAPFADARREQAAPDE